MQTKDAVEVDVLRPHLIGPLPSGSKGLVNRLANRKIVFFLLDNFEYDCIMLAYTTLSLLGRNHNRVPISAVYPAHDNCWRIHFPVSCCCNNVR
jgi:hypothetical protein